MLMDMDDNPAMALPNGQIFCRKYIYENAFLILNSKELKELRSHRESQIELSKTEFLDHDYTATTRRSINGKISKVQKDNNHKDDDELLEDESLLDEGDNDDMSTNEGSNISEDEDEVDEDDDDENDNDSIVTFTSEAGYFRNYKTSATSTSTGTSDYYEAASKLTFFSRWNTPSSLMFTCPITGVDYPLLAIRPVFIT